MKMLWEAIPFSQLPLSDDFMFGEVMRRPQICKLFLEELLQTEIARIEYISKQQDVSDSYTGHGIRLDIYLKDDANTVYSVEMQTSGGVVLFKRIRYYQGMIDRHNLKKGEHYSKLPESFIIMICTRDLFGFGYAVYKRKVIMEGCEAIEYDDGSHVYLLNTAYTIENASAAIIEFLRCIRSNDADPADYSTRLMKEICSAMAEVRSDLGKEAEYMTWRTKLMDIEYEALERGRNEGREEGREEGVEKGIQALVNSLQALSLDRRTIVEYVRTQFALSEEKAMCKVDQYWKKEL